MNYKECENKLTISHFEQVVKIDCRKCINIVRLVPQNFTSQPFEKVLKTSRNSQFSVRKRHSHFWFILRLQQNIQVNLCLCSSGPVDPLCFASSVTASLTFLAGITIIGTVESRYRARCGSPDSRMLRPLKNLPVEKSYQNSGSRTKR